MRPGPANRMPSATLSLSSQTEIGPLNEIIHIWRYSDLAERARIRAEASKDPNWPPKIQEFIRKMSSEIVAPFDFVPQVQPGKLGPIFEPFRTGRERNHVVLPICAMPHPERVERGAELEKSVRELSQKLANTPKLQRAVPQSYHFEDLAEISVLGEAEL